MESHVSKVLAICISRNPSKMMSKMSGSVAYGSTFARSFPLSTQEIKDASKMFAKAF